MFVFLKKEKKKPPFQHPMSTVLGLSGLMSHDKPKASSWAAHGARRGGARASPLGEGVEVEGNSVGSIVHGEAMSDVPGPEAGPTQGRGMSQLQ